MSGLRGFLRWIFLPLLSFDQREKYISTFGSRAVKKAMSEYESLGGSSQVIKKEITKTVINQIAKTLDTKIIVDKTPRYYQVLSDIKNIEDDSISLIILQRPILEVIF